MKFSVYYRIQNRDEFFEYFFKRYSVKLDDSIVEEVREKYSDLLELIVKMVLDKNIDDLKVMLCKYNSNVSREFFDYITNSKTKRKKKDYILKSIDNYFNVKQPNEGE